MKTQLQKRLEQLKQEFDAGQRMLGELQDKEARLRESMLRISGAIQVLEEELAKGGEEPAANPPVRAVV